MRYKFEFPRKIVRQNYVNVDMFTLYLPEIVTELIVIETDLIKNSSTRFILMKVQT